ncbi:OLC1v1039166C1 [Oldenlandia corymbosa var. corymbosa]|uniref:OLC1v1039166C1 n=1 Tax=Oldenlandia corymbosa var. corymbosa TaxID=529605 RepID=A0AAV1D1M4_OLDCO|nr:OLC1v1039166C1 [Oldenlandia corymbosa var. corymbosa]
MALRNFQMGMLDYAHENPDYEDEIEQRGQLPELGSDDHLFMLLLTTYDRIVERLKVAALELKETIVAETWGSGQNVGDFTLYSGALGTTFLPRKSFRVTQDEEDLRTCSEIVKACDSAPVCSRDVSFIKGRAGVCAFGAVVAKAMDGDELMISYLSKFKEIDLPADLSDGLMHGRASYLWACLFINKHLGKGTISSAHLWNGKNYWGAAHGVAGILIGGRNLMDQLWSTVEELLSRLLCVAFWLPVVCSIIFSRTTVVIPFGKVTESCELPALCLRSALHILLEFPRFYPSLDFTLEFPTIPSVVTMVLVVLTILIRRPVWIVNQGLWNSLWI